MSSPVALRASVVVVTRDRPQHLGRLLASLERQTVPPDEVVVVENASVISYAQVRERFAAGLPLRWVVEERPGIPAARNRGIREASGDLILFTDDDCEVEPRWVETLTRPFHRNPHIGAVGGEILAARREGSLVEEFCISESLLTMGRPGAADAAEAPDSELRTAASPALAAGRAAGAAEEQA